MGSPASSAPIAATDLAADALAEVADVLGGVLLPQWSAAASARTP